MTNLSIKEAAAEAGRPGRRRDPNAEGGLTECIWPKCRQYGYIEGTKLCKAHAAIVTYTVQTKHPEVNRVVDSMREHDESLKEAAEQAQRKAERAKEGPKVGMVYALQSGYNIKVGWTGRDLMDRLREYPPSTEVLVAYSAIRGEETRVKRRFAHLRTHGTEWLPYAPQVTEWVDEMVAEHGAPDPAWVCGPAKSQVARPHADKQTPRLRGDIRHVA